MGIVRSKIAFTIMEMVVVVSIVGVIALFAVPSYVKTVYRGYERSANTNLLIIYSAQKLAKGSGQGYKYQETLDSLNESLDLEIADSNASYICIDPGASEVICYADNISTGFSLSISSVYPNVCCDISRSGGKVCPSIANCP